MRGGTRVFYVPSLSMMSTVAMGGSMVTLSLSEISVRLAGNVSFRSTTSSSMIVTLTGTLVWVGEKRRRTVVAVKSLGSAGKKG